MDEKVFIRTLNFAALILVLSVGLIVFLISRRARNGYIVSKARLICHDGEANTEVLIRMLKFSEDHRYREHWGVDPIAIARALKNILLGKRLEGASTIEQQYVRTCTGNREVSIVRKLEEVSIAVLISIGSRKDDIAYSYISCGYYGEGLCGYKSAMSSLWPKGFELEMEATHAASVVAMLKRPKPVGCEKNWKKLHSQRVNYIVTRYLLACANNSSQARQP